MSAVGLIYVGIVLIVNGLLLLGWLTPREAGPLNLFVGALQVLTPTYLIFIAGGDLNAIFAASGIYLFGFTYLWVGINAVKDYSNRGFGWFALLVALCTLVYAAESFLRAQDAAFGVIWLLWGILWFLFFLVLGLERQHLAPATGVYTVVVGVITTVAALMTLLDGWSGSWTVAIVIAGVGVLALAVSAPAARPLTAPVKEVID